VSVSLLILGPSLRQVTIIHRRDTFRASKILFQRASSSPNITIMTNFLVEEWLPDHTSGSSPTLGGALIRHTQTGLFASLCVCLSPHTDLTGELTQLQFQGAFIAIGHRPSSQYFTDLVTSLLFLSPSLSHVPSRHPHRSH
jgi:thioredoxin reductase (NADPH)